MSTLLASSRQAVNLLLVAGQTSPTISDSSCLIAGMTGLGAISPTSGGKCVTLVANGTSGIVECAAHYPPTGETCVFGGNSYTITDFKTVSGTDIGFGLLNAKVTGVSPIKVLPASSSKWGGSMFGLPAIWVIGRSNRISLNQIISLSSSFYTGYFEAENYNNWPTASVGTPVIGGDSGSPLVTLVNGELVMLGAAYSSITGSPIAPHQTASEALWLSSWGITDTYTSYDLSSFSDYTTALETVTLTMTGPPADPSINAYFNLPVVASPGSLGTVYGLVSVSNSPTQLVGGSATLTAVLSGPADSSQTYTATLTSFVYQGSSNGVKVTSTGGTVVIFKASSGSRRDTVANYFQANGTTPLGRLPNITPNADAVQQQAASNGGNVSAASWDCNGYSCIGGGSITLASNGVFVVNDPTSTISVILDSIVAQTVNNAFGSTGYQAAVFTVGAITGDLEILGTSSVAFVSGSVDIQTNGSAPTFTGSCGENLTLTDDTEDESLSTCTANVVNVGGNVVINPGSTGPSTNFVNYTGTISGTITAAGGTIIGNQTTSKVMGLVTITGAATGTVCKNGNFVGGISVDNELLAAWFDPGSSYAGGVTIEGHIIVPPAGNVGRGTVYAGVTAGTLPLSASPNDLFKLDANGNRVPLAASVGQTMDQYLGLTH